MGVGKSAVSRELQRILPDCALLDSDNLWDMRPFVVNEDTKACVLANIIACLNNFLHKFRKSLTLKFCSFCAVIDHSGVKVHFHLVAVLNAFACLWTFNNGKADVDGISIEDPCKGFRDHTAHSCRFDSDRRMFS